MGWQPLCCAFPQHPALLCSSGFPESREGNFPGAFPASRDSSLWASISRLLAQFDVFRDNLGWRRIFAVAWSFPTSSKPDLLWPQKSSCDLMVSPTAGCVSWGERGNAGLCWSGEQAVPWCRATPDVPMQVLVAGRPAALSQCHQVAASVQGLVTIVPCLAHPGLALATSKCWAQLCSCPCCTSCPPVSLAL